MAEATGDPVALPKEVADSLLRTVLTAVGDANYWTHAANSKSSARPEYFAHLVVACMAAVDLTDVDERSYIERLTKLIGPRGDRSLHVMAELWADLAAWLADHPKTYRPLVLPDPRKWTRIGHTVRLAFPSRRDQLLLYRVLSSEGLLLEAPPLPPVVAAIQRKIGQFSARFGDEFSSFLADLKLGQPTNELVSSSLWAAIEAAVRLSLDERGDTARQRWTLLGEDDGFDVDLRIVTTHPSGLAGRDVHAVDHNPAPWRYELKGEDPLCHLLTGALEGAGALSNLARSGVVPLVQALHQDLEVARRQEFAEAECVLVRDDLVDEIVRRFGGTKGELAVPGWSVVRETKLRFVEPEEVEGTALATCWALHHSVFPRSIRFVGGISVEGGYLLQPNHLPSVLAEGAVSATAEIDDKLIDLRSSDGYFLLPGEALSKGSEIEITIVVEFPDEMRSTVVTLVPAPLSERYRYPNDLGGWLSEGCGQSAPLALDLEPDEVEAEVTYVPHADQVIYLGRAVGSRAATPTDAAWKIVQFGDCFVGSSAVVGLDPSPGTQTADAGARRRWRRALSSAVFPDPEDQRRSRAWVTAKGLETIETAEPFSTTIDVPQASAQRLKGLTETVVALSNRRQGLTTKRFIALCDDLLGLTPAEAWPVLRSWLESGALSDGVNRRWSNRRLFARQPRLVIFRTDRWFGARLSGLALESTLAFIERLAAEYGVLCARQRSETGYTPESTALRAASLEPLLKIAQAAGADVASKQVDPWNHGGGPDGTATLPTNYEARGRPLSEARWGGVSLQRWTRLDAPGYWVATAGQRQAWAYHRDTALLLGCLLAETPVVTKVGHRLVEVGAHLPLSVARSLNVVAPVLSGPSIDRSYSYHCPTDQYADDLRRRLTDFRTRMRGARNTQA